MLNCAKFEEDWTTFVLDIYKGPPFGFFFVIVVVFPQAPFRVRMFPEKPLPVSSNCPTALWLPEEAVGDFVTPFVLE